MYVTSDAYLAQAIRVREKHIAFTPRILHGSGARLLELSPFRIRLPTMAFSAEDTQRFQQIMDQVLNDPVAKAALLAKLGVGAPQQPAPTEPKVNNKAIEEKQYRRVDKYIGATGTWQDTRTMTCI